MGNARRKNRKEKLARKIAQLRRLNIGPSRIQNLSPQSLAIRQLNHPYLRNLGNLANLGNLRHLKNLRIKSLGIKKLASNISAVEQLFATIQRSAVQYQYLAEKPRGSLAKSGP